MSIDLRALVRRRKPDKRRAQLPLRAREALVHWAELPDAAPTVLLLDTTVYIHHAAGRLPAGLGEVVDRALLFHCSVCLGELAVGVANADPAHPSWLGLRDHYAELFALVPESRLLTPDASIWAEAGLVAGTLARTQGFQRHQRKECLNDALILLTAAKAGLAVLTANRNEFDLLQQLCPETRFVHY